MTDAHRKHAGIFCGGLRTIYHYSNSNHRVVSQTPDEFSRHYPAPDNPCPEAPVYRLRKLLPQSKENLAKLYALSRTPLEGRAF